MRFTATASLELTRGSFQRSTQSARSRNTSRIREFAIHTDCSPCRSFRVSSARSRGSSTTQDGHVHSWFGRLHSDIQNQPDKPAPADVGIS